VAPASISMASHGSLSRAPRQLWLRVDPTRQRAGLAVVNALGGVQRYGIVVEGRRLVL
jgi:hypothetical protein